jgi:hypothetical protein
MLEITITATEVVPQFTGITITGKKADSGVLSQVGKVAGIALATILNGFSGPVKLIGEMENRSWGWTAGDPIFINGTTLSSVPPTSGWVQKVGKAKSATTVIVELEQPILL